MKKNNLCPICNIKLGKSISVSGPEVTYTRKMNIGKSIINFCTDCGLGVNQSFKPFDFAEVKYSNIDKNFINDDDDDSLLWQISTYLKDFLPQIKKSESRICLEIGAGKRLTLLNKIASRFDINSYAIDPIYLKNEKFSNVILKTDISDLDPHIRPSIFIARNCLEYFSPKDILSIFKKTLHENILILIELQSFEDNKWGNVFYFREYKYFYTKLAFEKLLLKACFNIQWLSSFSKYGDERRTYLAYVSKDQSKNKSIYHKDIDDLVNHLKRMKSQKKIYLWGAGGRGLNFIYNEGKGLVDVVIDSSDSRQGILLKGYGEVIKPNLSIKDSIIILLNSNFISYIPSIIKKQNSIFLIS